MTPDFSVAASAQVSADATVGEGTRIWDAAQVREHALIGEFCIVGRGAYIDHGVIIGDRCKIQNSALVYAPARLGSGVFIGPGVILTNDRYPRAVTPEGTLKSGTDWEPLRVTIGDGGSIGAGSIVLGGVTIGQWAIVGAGSTVTRDVPSHALVVGSPARVIGWVGKSGRRLEQDGDGILVDVGSSQRYAVHSNGIRELT